MVTDPNQEEKGPQDRYDNRGRDTPGRRETRDYRDNRERRRTSERDRDRERESSVHNPLRTDFLSFGCRVKSSAVLSLNPEATDEGKLEHRTKNGTE